MSARNIALTVMVAIDDNETPVRYAARAVDDKNQPIEDADAFFIWLLTAQHLGNVEGLAPKQRSFAKSCFEQYMKHLTKQADSPCQVCESRGMPGVTSTKHSILLDHPHTPVPPHIAAQREMKEKTGGG